MSSGQQPPGPVGPVGSPGGLQGPIGKKPLNQIFAAWDRLNRSLTVNLYQSARRSKKLSASALRGRRK